MTKDNEKLKADLIISNAAEVVTCAAKTDDPIGRIVNGSIAVSGEKIIAVGPAAEVSSKVDVTSAEVLDASGKMVSPGFVDCHTHFVFGGSRSREYAAKMTRSAVEVASLGIPTGIPASVKMTRETEPDLLLEESSMRLKRMFESGSTTIESKSGYGLSWEHEHKQLKTNQQLSERFPPDLVSTFLGAHEFPEELPRERYVDRLVEEMIPRVIESGLAEFCDVYCDEGVYTVEQTGRILKAGLEGGLKPKIHADAYSHTGVTDLAIELGAVSMDHLNYTTPDEMKRLAQMDGIVGVGLPALDFAVNHPIPFDARAIINSGMTLALATNLNPGNWTETMHFVLVLACRRHAMSPEEAMLASTLGAAKAILRESEIGSLELGKLADILIWDLPSFEELIYRLDQNLIACVIKRGRMEFDIRA